MAANPRLHLPRAPRPVFPRGSVHHDRPPQEVAEREAVAPTREVKWDDFLAFYFDWAQGEHLSLIGPTGAGKTTLALQLLPVRDYVLAIATKERDPVLYKLESQGYTQMDRFNTPVEVSPRVVLAAPLPHGSDSLPEQRRIVKEALVSVYRQGGWCVYLDEVRYVTNNLNLKSDVELLYLQGRSAGISLVVGTQRPAHVPLETYDQATHLFFWRDNDRRNLERIAEIGGAFNKRAVMAEVASLPKHTVLYVNTRTDAKVKVKPPAG